MVAPQPSHFCQSPSGTPRLALGAAGFSVDDAGGSVATFTGSVPLLAEPPTAVPAAVGMVLGRGERRRSMRVCQRALKHDLGVDDGEAAAMVPRIVARELPVRLRRNWRVEAVGISALLRPMEPWQSVFQSQLDRGRLVAIDTG